ncbi:hypothetical protein LWI29_036098 [Acer saccharum]|uniref:Uncharacterized protein n=1 Tax=Acer saccharum TaxID=4024 RepID=A0AA39S1A0_ACESA|nr:hypothetical protein LWI29_036098 [Acer saccharum]
MPFGLTNAPATFQSLMNDLFWPHLRKFILVFFDDILIYSKTWIDHLEHLQQVEYLGHLISADGVAVDPAKIQSVQGWPIPTNTRGVRGFLGLAGYYRKFVRGFGAIAAPLNRLLSKDGFKWTLESETAFAKLKSALISPPVLRLPDFSKTFVVECDASGVGLGAILSQENQPIAFFSEALKGTSLKLSTYEKEMLAVVKAVRKWRPFWASLPVAEWWASLQKEVNTDPYYASLPSLRYPHSSQRDGVWVQQGKVLLSPTSKLIPAILDEGHSSPAGDHFGFVKTIDRISSSFNWPGMRAVVKEFIRSCNTCQWCKYDNMRPAGLLQPLPIPDKVWTEISMDFIEGLPTSQGQDVIMVVVDRLSKYAHFVPLKHPFTASSVANAFVRNIVKLHGVPISIVSDRDKIFISSFWKSLFQSQGTELLLSSSYHPQTDGQTEVVNRTLEQYLRCFTCDQPKKWMDWLPWAEYSYNTTTHSSTQTTPFKAV